MTLDRDLPTILLSIETAARELDSKLVMASALAGAGCRAIVAHKGVARQIAQVSRCIVWQGKSVPVHDLIANGSAIMFLTDEGGMFQRDSWSEQVLEKHLVDQLPADGLQRMCVWGRRQLEVIRKYAPPFERTLRVTGSPRFDLCLPRFSWITESEDRSDVAIADPFVLVCTRFGAVAHTKGMAHPFLKKLDPRKWPEGLSQSEITDLWFKKWRQDTHDLAEFVVLVKEIAVHRSDLTIVVRPHPSESLEFYEQAFSTLANVTVRREGSVLRWIRDARLVIHSNSTTGIEAVLAGRPVLNFLPDGSSREGLDVEVACEAGVTVRSVASAVEGADRLLGGGQFSQIWSQEAVDALQNLTSEAVPLLVDETLEVVRERGLESPTVSLPKDGRLASRLRRAFGKTSEEGYVASKRGKLSAAYVDSVLMGCRAHGVGAGEARLVRDTHAVIEPA